MVIDGVRYDYFDGDLTQWQQDAINGEEMDPMTMQLDSERRIISLKGVPSTT